MAGVSRFDAVDKVLYQVPGQTKSVDTNPSEVVSHQPKSLETESGQPMTPGPGSGQPKQEIPVLLRSDQLIPSEMASNHIISYPWQTANPKVKIAFQLRLTEPMHARLKWLSDQKGEGSIHEIILSALEDKVDKMIKEHGAG